jgi:hypothetical protein
MRKSKLSKQKQKRLVEYFVVGATARSTSIKIMKNQRGLLKTHITSYRDHTINPFYRRMVYFRNLSISILYLRYLPLLIILHNEKALHTYITTIFPTRRQYFQNFPPGARHPSYYLQPRLHYP